MFKKGDPRINRAGRPVGAVDHKWHDLKWWFSLITDNVEKLTPKEKVDLGLKGWGLLVSKMPSLPSTPDESRDRVLDAINADKEIDAIENGNSRPAESITTIVKPERD